MTMSSSRNSSRRPIILAPLFMAMSSVIQTQPACADEVTRVFLFAGQSNMDDLQPVADVVPVAQSLRSHVARTDDRQPPPGIFGVSAANQFLFSRSSKKTTVTHAKSNAETPATGRSSLDSFSVQSWSKYGFELPSCCQIVFDVCVPRFGAWQFAGDFEQCH